MKEEHEKFLKELSELRAAHGIDLAMLPDDERGYVKLCAVSEGVFTELCRVDSYRNDYVYLP